MSNGKGFTMIKQQNELGSIVLSDDFLANLAGYAATTCFGVAGMASSDTADKLISAVNSKRLSKGVKIRESDGAVDIDLHIIVSYGTNITAIVNSIAHRVRYVMEDMCDFKVREINTYVDGMKA